VIADDVVNDDSIYEVKIISQICSCIPLVTGGNILEYSNSRPFGHTSNEKEIADPCSKAVVRSSVELGDLVACMNLFSNYMRKRPKPASEEPSKPS